ncbi:winged helix-turn-helix domain-containing protein [Zhengella mangrovi]|nr:winged helix-turn-helix domain-containing protein [Zhengella mangrovi]
MALSEQRFRLLDWLVDAPSGRISRDGEEAKLEPKMMDVLVFLAGHPNLVISRSTLEEAVWADTIVSYETLTSTVQKLRKVLGDDARDPRYIETVSKKGYRMVAPVTLPGHEGSHALRTRDAGSTPRTTPARRRLLTALGAILVVLAILAVFRTGQVDEAGPLAVSRFPEKSVAILPFKNVGGDSTQDYFADGITIDLITDVSKISGLFVIAQNSTFAYKDDPAPLDQIARDLGARYLVQGSVRRSGDHVRVNVNIVDSETGAYLWTDRYDRQLSDVFALQDDLTKQIVTALSVRLTPHEEVGLSEYAKVDPAAYDLYLKGQARVAVYSPEANAEAREFFEQSIAMDPSFGRAQGGLALAHAVDATFGWSNDPDLSRRLAAKHARAALALDERSPQMHYVLAQVYGSERRIEDGIAELREAVALDANYADGHVVLGLFLAYAGRPEDAIVSIRKGMKLSPRHGYIYPYALSNAYFVMERYDEAVAIIENVLERNNNFQQGRLLLISIYGLLDRKDDAEWEIAEVLAALPGFSIADEEARVRFARPDLRARYVAGLRKAGLPR